MRENGLMIRLTAKANTLMPMEQLMKETGKQTSNMGMELSIGLMERIMRGIFRMLLKKDKEC
jgi:hypothetical protein